MGGRHPRDRNGEAEAEQVELDDERAPLHPMRVYKGLAEVLDRDAIVIGDGGDFVSYAGKVVETHEPGCWMDLARTAARRRTRSGDRRQARAPRPAGLPARRRRLRLLGLRVRHDGQGHGIPVVGVIGNNGDLAEHHLMKFLYGYSVAAELRPETPLRPGRRGARLPCRAGLRPGRVGAGARAHIRVRQPAPVNVLTDPEVVYPRKSNLVEADARSAWRRPLTAQSAVSANSPPAAPTARSVSAGAPMTVPVRPRAPR